MGGGGLDPAPKLMSFLLEQFIDVEEKPKFRGWQGDILGSVFYIALPEFFIERPGSCREFLMLILLVLFEESK
jgi:hypothetical protein